MNTDASSETHEGDPQFEPIELLTGEAAVAANQLFDRKGTSRFAILTIFLICGFFIALTIWAYFLPLAEISVSSGEVVPSEQIQSVQHLEGGIVSSIHVSEGQRVAAGEPLLELAPDIARSELDQLQTRFSGVLLKIDMLESTLDGGQPELGQVKAQYRKIAEVEFKALKAQRESVDSQSAVLSQQVRERKAELEALESQKTTMDEQVSLLREQIDARRSLVEKGLFSRLQLIESERALSALIGQKATLEIDASRISERILESQSRLVELEAKFQSDMATEMSQLTREAAELQLNIDRARDRVERLKIVAPMTGRVKGLQTKTIGGVVAPGATLMEIVPDLARPLVEVRISTRDIGHIRPGQKAKIKVLTYDYTRYGLIEGEVSGISPSTFSPEEGAPYYKAYIDLEEDFVGGDSSRPVIPGMTVLADIVTGDRSLLDYLLAPIRRSVDAALHER